MDLSTERIEVSSTARTSAYVEDISKCVCRTDRYISRCIKVYVRSARASSSYASPV